MAGKSEVAKPATPEEKEKNEFYEAFKLFDKDMDGKISGQELRDVSWKVPQDKNRFPNSGNKGEM